MTTEISAPPGPEVVPEAPHPEGLLARELPEARVPSISANGESVAEEVPAASPARIAVAAGIASAGAAFVAGGMFQGNLARACGVAAAVSGAGLVGIAASRGRTWLQYLALPAIFVLGYLAAIVFPNTTGQKGTLPALINAAITNGGLAKPPLPFDPGWRFLLIALIGLVGAGGASLGAGFNRPRLAILVPLPLLVATALNQPAGRELAGAVAGLAAVSLALSVCYGAELSGKARLSRATQVRQLAKSAAAVAGCLVVLVALNQASFFFPNVHSRAASPQRPKVVPLSAVPNRPLFAVRSALRGPWQLGVLDTYQRSYWLLPGYDPGRLIPMRPGAPVPAAPPPRATVTSTFTIADLGGFDMPTPAQPRSVRVAGSVSYDPRLQVFRETGGALRQGLTYRVSSAIPPTGSQLAAAANFATPTSVRPFLAAPPVPAAIAAMLTQAPANRWQRLQFLRTRLYDHVVASGPGLPVAVPPTEVVSMMDGGKATPFEIVAGEALIARWAGLPSRIGYGFYGGTPLPNGTISFRPRDGANWLEVYFPGYGWIPILGTPLHAEASLNAQQKRTQPQIRPSDQILLQIYVPVLNPNPQLFFEEVRFWLLRALGLAVAVLVFWRSLPLVARRLRRGRRARWAASHGIAGRIAVAYADFRDHAIDLALDGGAATPLEYLALVQRDLEHSELAWLTTRALWGDLARGLTDGDAAAAEAMSASLRRRLSRAQTGLVRVSALSSKASLRRPFDAALPNVWPRPRVRRSWLARLTARLVGPGTAVARLPMGARLLSGISR